MILLSTTWCDNITRYLISKKTVFGFEIFCLILLSLPYRHDTFLTCQNFVNDLTRHVFNKINFLILRHQYDEKFLIKEQNLIIELLVHEVKREIKVEEQPSFYTYLKIYFDLYPDLYCD